MSGVDRVYAFLGGFHLKGNDRLTERTIDYLKKFNIGIIRTGHCTKFDDLMQFANAFGSKPFASGMTIEL